jgi:DNA polymerase-3 subunit delta'
VRLDAHPHAAAVLGSALRGQPSHAYLLAGPAGSGKRDAAREFAAELLAPDSPEARARVMSGAHVDLTWVAPSGAHEMLRSDVDEAVVSAATRTPFEAQRRVFVIERADTMNDEAANTLLKTLEEPPSYVVLLLLTDRPGQVLPTIASRCQTVRFDPLPPERIAAQLSGVDDRTALACARLCLGDAERAAELATPAGAALRAAAEELVRTGEWRPILVAGQMRGAVVRDELERARDEELEYLPKKDQRRKATEHDDRIKRGERRARTGAVDHALQLAGLYLRDLACVAAGAPDLVHNADRELDADGLGGPALRDALELVEDTRARLLLNVAEDLALEALSLRLQRVLAR